MILIILINSASKIKSQVKSIQQSFAYFNPITD